MQKMGKLFGTDGIRGIAYKEPMTAKTAARVGRAVAQTLKKSTRPAKIIIGRDTRISGRLFEQAVARGITSTGAQVLLAGVLPTPGIALLSRVMNADGAIVISASHNPWSDNGIKVFSGQGFKLSTHTEKQIESAVAGVHARSNADKFGGKLKIRGAAEIYSEYCISTSDCLLDGLKLVLDCANGSTYETAPKVFKALGANITVISNKPDGKNINYMCGSEYPDKLVKAVNRTGADAGFAFDGDGDRLTAVDEKGNILTGDHIMAICADHMNARRSLKNNLLVTTIMSNAGLKAAMAKTGIKCIEAGVGDREVMELMKKKGATLGGEQSGHVIFLDRHTTGDGIVTAVQLANVIMQAKKRLSSLASIMTPFPQKLINVEVARKPVITKCRKIIQSIRLAEKSLAGRGRVLVRYSGTQPMCRVMVEGPDKHVVGKFASLIAQAVKEDIGS